MEFTRESLSNLPFVNKKRDGFIHPAHAINHRFSIDTETYPSVNKNIPRKRNTVPLVNRLAISVVKAEGTSGQV